MSVCIPCIFRYFDDLGIIILPFAFALRFFELQTAPWKPQGNQRVIESSSWVSWVLGKWNLVSSARHAKWMSFSRFWTKLFLGTHPHNYWNIRNARYCKKMNGFALHTYRRTKPTFWIKLFILSHELTWRQPLTLYNFSQKWMQVQNHAVASATQQWKKRSYQNVSSSQTWQWRITHLFSQRTKPPFWLGSSQLSMFDYRSVATGHQAPPFSRATIFTAVSHPWRVRSMQHAEARILQCQRDYSSWEHDATKMGAEYIVSLESNIKPDIYSLGCC